MLYQVAIKDGFAQVKGAGKFIKIISAATSVRMQVSDPEGRVLLDSKFRAPMATEFDSVAQTINLYAEDQVLELWYSLQPLEFLQLSALGASRGVSKSIFAYKGLNLLAPSNPRKSLRISAEKGIFIGDSTVNSDGWYIAPQEKEEFEITGDVFGWVGGVDLVMDKIQDAVVMPSAVTGGNMAYSVCRFNGATYIGNGALRKVNDADGSSEVVASAGAAQSVVSYLGTLYVLASDGGMVVLKSSQDGIEFKNESAVFGSLGSHGAHSFKSSIVAGLGVTDAQSGSYYLVDFNKKKLFRCVAPTSDPRSMATDGEHIYHATGTELRRLSVEEAKAGSSMELIYTFSQAINRIGVDPITKELFAVSDGKVRKWTGSAFFEYAPTVIAESVFIYIGKPAFVSSNKIVIIDGNNAVEKSLSSSLLNFSVFSSADEQKIFRIEATFANPAAYQSIEVGEFDNGEPTIVKILEFLS